MTYNRDLQEDKERLFDTADTVSDCLCIMAAMLEKAEVKRQVCWAAASDPLLLATDMADWLVKKGMPFRQAHHAVGAAVGLAEQKGIAFDQIPLEELAKISPLFDASCQGLFDLKKALHNRTTIGAPNPKQVLAQIKKWQKRLK